jgi:hypothetical protein
MRLVFLALALAAPALAAVPRELALALENFRADPPRGWSYTQTTTAEGKTTVERCDARKPEFNRWTLVQKDGRAPTADETRHYNELRARRSRSGAAPKITDQFDLETIESVRDEPARATYRCRLRPGEITDSTARHLRATIVVHKPTRTVQSIELANVAEFSPTLGVKIRESETPMLPQNVSTRVRGTAFWFKSLDADMTVTFSEFEPVKR